MDSSSVSAMYRISFACFMCVCAASFFSLFEEDKPRGKSTKKKQSSMKDDTSQSRPMLFDPSQQTKQGTATVTEGLPGGKESQPNPTKNMETPTMEPTTKENEQSAILQSMAEMESAHQVQLEALLRELERSRSQVKREEELRLIAEDSLNLCQVQLRKEQEAVQLLRKKVIGLEAKLSSSSENQKVKSSPHHADTPQVPE